MRLLNLDYPTDGTFRVSRNPARLSGGIREHPAGLLRNETAGSRFDDPLGVFKVRYTADRLRGCLVETMAQFRPSASAEDALAAVEGAEPEDGECPDQERSDGLADWLAQQRVGKVVVAPGTVACDVDAPETLVDLDKHWLVRKALDESALSTSKVRARLDAAVIRLPGPVGRPITQAVSRALYEEEPDLGVLRYRSRLDDAENCWAIYDRCDVSITDLGALDAAVPDHLVAVRSVATLFELPLPDHWN